MDIISTEDRSVAKEKLADKYKNSVEINTLGSCTEVTKNEKKKSENKKLRKKLNEIEEQNQTLTKLINDKSNEISELKKSVKSLNEVLNSVPIHELRTNSSIASDKLLDLSKKNRQLRAELESTKTRLNRKEQQVHKLEKDLQNEKEKLQRNNESLKNSNPAHVEEMQSKLTAMQQKLFETRNKNVELNAQLKLAQKCLQQEIGENFNLNLLAGQANISSWRGRAQQILNLQQKVKDLQERLDGNKQHELANEPIYSFPNHIIGSSVSLGSLERPTVKKTEIQHRAKVENLEKDIINLKSELEDQRNKILALKVRNKTLSDEISRYKLKATSSEEQTDCNNINVAAMNERLNQQKKYYEKLISQNSKETEKLLKEMQEMKLIKKHLEEKITELEMLLSNKNNSIEELNFKLEKLEQDLRAITGDFLFSCRDFRKDEFITILDSLETEKFSLLDLNKKLNERLNNERLKSENLFEQVSKQKIRISRLEVKVRDLECELEVQAEKKKRIQRIAEYTANLSTKSSTSSIGSFTFDNTSLAGSLNNNNNSEHQPDENLNELKYRHELTVEKITMLKEKLDYLSAEKENDIKTFHEIISNSKNVLVEMILSHHQRNSTDSNV